MKNKFRALLDHVRHRLFHGEQHYLQEHGDREIFLRCALCGLRSPGVQLGPGPRPALAGDPVRATTLVASVSRVVPPLVPAPVTDEIQWLVHEDEDDFPSMRQVH